MIEESCATDLDRMTPMPGTPLSTSSSGTVTCASTSADERPRQIVWTSIRGGANSGKTSTGSSCSRPIPKYMTLTPITRTMKRKRKLHLTIAAIIVVASWSSILASSSFRVTAGAVQWV